MAEPYIERCRRMIEEQYLDHPTGCGGSFGEILCHEIHTQGLTFVWLAQKWGLSLAMLGELIADHCRRLDELPAVNHDYRHASRAAAPPSTPCASCDEPATRTDCDGYPRCASCGPPGAAAPPEEPDGTPTERQEEHDA